MLDAAIDGAMDALVLHALLELGLGVGQKLLMGGEAGLQLGLDVIIAHRVEILEGQIFQFPLDALHTQAVSQRSVDLHGLQCLFPLLLRRLVLHGAHIV